MTTLKDLLDSLEIKTDDLEEKEEKEEINIKDLKIDEIPEKQRPYFQKLMEETEHLKNEVATRDLALKTIKQSFPKQQPEKKEEKEPEKILGVLDPSDPYAPAFKRLADMIDGVSKKEETDSETKFKENLVKFAGEHKDIVRYATDMDRLVEEHPSLMRDIPKLYTLAKTIAEGRENKSKDKREELERTGKLKNFSAERSGTSSTNIGGITGTAKSIAEAFGAAEKQLSTRR